MYSKIIYILLIFLGFLYIYSLFPVFSTGDGGGLVVSSYLLGIAHPPGYPLYVELGKFFTFIPLANLGIRVGLISVLFSLLSLYLVYRITFYLSKCTSCSIFSVLILAFSCSYYYNSVVEKFYTLNLFFILFLTYLGIKTILSNSLNKKDVFLSSFLLGLLTSVHHTGLLVAVPLFIVGLFYFKEFFKSLLAGFFFFLIGFLVNIHLYIRSLKGVFSAAHTADSFEKFMAMILRKFYRESSSVDAPLNAISTLDGFVNLFENLFILVTNNLTYGSLALSIVGLVYIYMFNKKVFYFLVSLLVVYGIFLGKITLSGDFDLSTAYISANQYFLPLLALFSMMMGIGIHFLLDMLKGLNLLFARGIFKFSMLIIPFSILPLTFTSSNHKENWVPYYHGKDILSILPVSSVISTYGDNNTFELWYLKLVGRYRDDVCHITSHYYNSANWRLEGCKPVGIYKPLIPDFFKGDFVSLSQNYRLFSSVALSKEHPLSTVFIHYPYEFIFAYLEKDKAAKYTLFLEKLNQENFKFLTPEVCLSHETDDLFTMEMCNFFSNSYLVLASTIKPKFFLNQNKIEVDASISYGRFLAPFKLEIYANSENRVYLEMYKAIRAYNDMKKFYFYKEKN